MKPLPFPYGIAAELWLFGPPARKQTFFHLMTLIGLFGSGTIVFAALEDEIGRFLSVIAGIPVGLIVACGIYWCVAHCMPLLHWLVSKGIIEAPDETKFKEKIIWTACWKAEESNEKEPNQSE